MFRKLSESIASLLIINNIVSNENREAYIYGLELLFPQILFYLGIIVIVFFTNTILLSLLFVITYKVLRQYTGGFHCKSAEMCLVVSILMYLPLLLLFNLNLAMIDMALVITSIIASVVIFWYSPIEDNNKPLDSTEKRVYRKLSIILTIIAIFAILICFSLNIRVIFYAVAWSLSADAVLIILTFRRCKNEENDIKDSGSNG